MKCDKVKRWDMRYQSAVMGMEPEARMVEHLSGHYVLASDYDKLVQQYAELGQGLAEWEPILTKFLTGLANGNSDDPRICAEAEGLAQYLPQLRALTSTDLTDHCSACGAEGAQDGEEDGEEVEAACCSCCHARITESESFVNDGYCQSCYDNPCPDCDMPANKCSCYTCQANL